MATKKRSFLKDHYYHVFNRGVEKRKIFLDYGDYQRFVETIEHCLARSGKLSRINKLSRDNQFESSVAIVAFCLMPNHFHMLLKQTQDRGIPKFLSRLTNSYTKYFNTKRERVGPLFQGSFSSIEVQSDEQLIHLSRYIHLNPLVSGITSDLRAYQWSSYKDFLNTPTNEFVSPQIVLEQLSPNNSYENFVLDQIDYAKKLEELKHLNLD